MRQVVLEAGKLNKKQLRQLELGEGPIAVEARASAARALGANAGGTEALPVVILVERKKKKKKKKNRGVVSSLLGG
jgi:hypothetical protein